MIWIRVASAFMFLGVAMGAMGAHLWKEKLSTGGLDLFQKGVLYHLIHGLALFGIAWLSVTLRSRAVNSAGILFSLGIVLFSGSLYAIALTGIKKFGMVAPIGGLLFLIGWLILLLLPTGRI